MLNGLQAFDRNLLQYHRDVVIYTSDENSEGEQTISVNGDLQSFKFTDIKKAFKLSLANGLAVDDSAKQLILNDKFNGKDNDINQQRRHGF